jgi:exoribonuclease-2
VPAFDGDTLRGIVPEAPNRARLLIENLMISSNVVTATFLDKSGLPSLRRVVRTPKRWDRIRDLAATAGTTLPETPDSLALAQFLDHQRETQPDHFPDLSASVLSLIGSGEYVVDPPGAEAPGHFGLAVRDYSHSTAPNRRYPDLVTQRLIKAALVMASAPYAIDALEAVAAKCTAQEDAAKKVERQVRKAATAMLMESRVGQSFDGIVTSASEKGTYVRVSSPPMEGRVMRGLQGLDVGDRVHVRLDRVDAERGYIDFTR